MYHGWARVYDSEETCKQIYLRKPTTDMSSLQAWEGEHTTPDTYETGPNIDHVAQQRQQAAHKLKTEENSVKAQKTRPHPQRQQAGSDRAPRKMARHRKNQDQERHLGPRLCLALRKTPPDVSPCYEREQHQTSKFHPSPRVSNPNRVDAGTDGHAGFVSQICIQRIFYMLRWAGDENKEPRRYCVQRLHMNEIADAKNTWPWADKRATDRRPPDMAC